MQVRASGAHVTAAQQKTSIASQIHHKHQKFPKDKRHARTRTTTQPSNQATKQPSNQATGVSTVSV